MKAVVCHQSELGVADVPDPVPGPGQVLLEVSRAGICGSDLHARKHADQLADLASAIGYLDVMRPAEHVVMGHEFSGRVVEYGPATRRRWTPGTPVVALPMIRIGDQVQMTGLSARASGAYAERVLVQESLTMEVPNGLDVETAALTEPMAVAWHAVRRSRVRKRAAAVVRLRSDRACRDPDAEGAGCEDGDRQRLLAGPSCARRGVWRRRRARPGCRVAVDQLSSRAATFTDANQLFDLALGAMGKLRRVPLLPWWQCSAQPRPRAPHPAARSCSSAWECRESSTTSWPTLRWPRASWWSGSAWSRTRSIRRWRSTRRSTSVRFRLPAARVPGHPAPDRGREGRPDAAVTGTVGLDGVAGAFEALGDPERHAKILIDPTSAVTAV